MAPHEQDAIGKLPAQHRSDPPLDVFDRQVLDALAPDRDPLEERAGPVVAGLPDRQDGVEVDVRLDQGRRDERAGRVDRLAGTARGLRCVHDSAVADRDVGDAGRARQAGVADQQVERLRHQWLPEPNYSPRNIGRRFSWNARIPSARSALRLTRWISATI